MTVEDNKEIFIDDNAIVESAHIGNGTKIWAFVHVLENAKIGEDCNIGEHCFIENDVEVGDEVVVKNGVYLWDGVRISNRVFIGPHVVFTNDYLPRAKIYLENPVETYVLEGASIGANATILCGITIGSYAMIGAGAVVTRSVPDYTLVYGNPASNGGYVCECGKILNFEHEISNCECGKKYSMAKDGGVIRLLN